MTNIIIRNIEVSDKINKEKAKKIARQSINLLNKKIIEVQIKQMKTKTKIAVAFTSRLTRVNSEIKAQIKKDLKNSLN